MIKRASWWKPLAELLTATAFWGFGFTATVWALQGLDVSALVFYRFIGAFLFGSLPYLLRRSQWSVLFRRDQLRAALLPAFWLFLTIALQAIGLFTTTATKSAFLTILYVIFVPFLTAITGRERPRLAHFGCVGLALLGIALFQNLQWQGWSVGDGLTVLAAWAAAFHILTIANRAQKVKNGYVFNLWQCFWTGLMGLALMPWGGQRWSLVDLNAKEAWGFLALSLGSSLLGFFLQVRAQEKIPPNLASMLFLLESPFSALFAFFLLNEKLEMHHFLGGFTILLACVWAIRVDLPAR